MNQPLKNILTQKVWKKLSNHAKKSLMRAEKMFGSFDYGKIEAIHLLYSISAEKGSLGKNILSDLNIGEENILKILKNRNKSNEADASKIAPDELKKVFIRAYAIAKNTGFSYVGTEHLAYALLESENPEIKKIFAESRAKNNSKKEKSNDELQLMDQAAKSLMESDQFPSLSRIMGLAGVSAKKNPGAASATPFVNKFCIDINKETELRKEAVIGREAEIGRIINILGRKNKNNPLLVGDPGVGKTVLVSGLARLINAGQVPPALYGKKIMGLDVAQLIAGTSFRGEFESRLKEIIKEVSESKNIILFIDEIHNIVGAGNVAGSLDLANILKPALAHGDLQLIGATTFSEFKKYIEKDAALERRFQPVSVKEPDEGETKKILFGIKELYESFHNVSMSDEAINMAVELSSRYIQNRFLPDKAIDVIDETAANIRSQRRASEYFLLIKEAEEEKNKLAREKDKLVTEENFEKAIGLRTREAELDGKLKILREKNLALEKENRIKITAADITKTVAAISGIPEEKLSRETAGKTVNIQKILSTKVIGQDEIMEKISKSLLRSQLEISNPDRPLGSFLFLGPTGVGKTLTARTLASEFFGSAAALIRIDMSELMERHSVSSLIGSPAGYIGYGEGGNLTEKVRRNPYSVVLFDEIEKAHPDVFNIFLQILEDGILTDAEGTRVNFKNTVVILTSNIGTEEFTAAAKVGFATEKNKKAGLAKEQFENIKEAVIKELGAKLRPELLNRLDHILVFNPLNEKDILKITQAELKKLGSRILRRGIKIIFEKNAVRFIAQKSLDPKQGARLVRKNIQELVEDPIAEMIVGSKVRDGKITVGIEKGKIKLT